MADVKLEHKQSLSREDAAVWLHALSRAFTHGGDVELPVGEGGKVGLHLPERVEAEFEVEVDGDEVQVEIEFTWSTARHDDDGQEGAQPGGEERDEQ
jgi:amphi-Trp domain-containing protein